MQQTRTPLTLIFFAAMAFICTSTLSYAARPVNQKYYRYFPANSKFVGIVGPLGDLQGRAKRLLQHLKNRNPIGIMVPAMMAKAKQQLGFNPLSTKSLGKYGLSARTELWFAAIRMKSPERFLGLIAPCNPAKLSQVIRKSTKTSLVHTDKFKNYKIVTLYDKPKPAKKGKRGIMTKATGFSGATYIAQGKGLFFLGWTAAVGVPLQKVLLSVKGDLVAAMSNRKANIGTNRSFRKAISMARRDSSLFVYLDGSLIKSNQNKGINRLTGNMLRNLPRTPFGAALKKQPQFTWGFAEFQLDNKSIDFRGFAAMRKSDKEFQLLRKVFRTASGPSTKMQNTVKPNTLMTGKTVLNVIGSFKAFLRDLQRNPKKASEYRRVRRQLKKFKADTGVDAERDIMELFSGHFMFNLYGISPRIATVVSMSRQQRSKIQMNDLVDMAAIAEVKSKKDARSVLARLIAFGNKRAPKGKQVASFKKYGTTLYTVPIERNVSIYFGVIGRRFVLASNIATFQKVSGRGGTKARMLRRAIAARQGALMFISATAIRNTIGKMKLPFAQRMIVSNVLQYLGGLQGIYTAFTVRRNGIGVGFGLVLDR